MNDRTLPTDDAKTAIGVDDRGRMNYPSSAASGHIEIELPSLPGSPNSSERLHTRDFGPHVIGKIEASLKKSPYLETGTQQSPAGVMRHYAAVAKGANLMDSGTLERMEQLSKEFDAAPDRGEFFSQTVRPYLVGLTPKRR